MSELSEAQQQIEELKRVAQSLCYDLASEFHPEWELGDPRLQELADGIFKEHPVKPQRSVLGPAPINMTVQGMLPVPTEAEKQLAEARAERDELAGQVNHDCAFHDEMALTNQIHNRFCGENGEPCQVCRLKAERKEKK